MSGLSQIKRALLVDRKSIVVALKNAKHTRDGAPSAMESHHDTTRNQAEKLITALEGSLADLDDLISKIPNNVKSKPGVIGLWSQVHFLMGGSEMDIALVVNGLGGRDVSGVKLVSVASPLGVAVLGLSENDEVEFGGNTIRILSVN